MLRYGDDFRTMDLDGGRPPLKDNEYGHEEVGHMPMEAEA